MLSRKHLNGMKRDKSKSQSIEQCLQRQLSRDILPTDMRVFRFEVLETLLMDGIPISKKYGHSLTTSAHKKDIILSVEFRNLILYHLLINQATRV